MFRKQITILAMQDFAGFNRQSVLFLVIFTLCGLAAVPAEGVKRSVLTNDFLLNTSIPVKSAKILCSRTTLYLTPARHPPHAPRFFADLAVSNPRFVEPSSNRALDAEERGHIAFTLENHGRGRAEEVEVALVLLTDTAYLTYPKTTQLDSLTSGESKTIEIPVTAGFDVVDGTTTFRIAVSEKWGFEPHPFTVTFESRFL